MRAPSWLPLTLAAVTLAAISLAVARASAKGGRFGAELVARALEDLERVVETAHNSGPIVDRYLADVGANPGDNWCAAASSAWIRDAAERSGDARILGVVQLTGGAKATADGPKRAGWYVPASELPRAPAELHALVPPGSVSIWDRSQPAGSSWPGHIGVLEKWTGPAEYQSIEGNSGPAGDRVARMVRTVEDPRLEGFVIWPA